LGSLGVPTRNYLLSAGRAVLMLVEGRVEDTRRDVPHRTVFQTFGNFGVTSEADRWQFIHLPGVGAGLYVMLECPKLYAGVWALTGLLGVPKALVTRIHGEWRVATRHGAGHIQRQLSEVA
jgi:hypothetical protein